MSNGLTNDLQGGLIREAIPIEDWTRKDGIPKTFVSPLEIFNTIFFQSSTSKFALFFIIFSIFYILPIFQLYPTEHTCFAFFITILFFWSFDSKLNINPYFISYLIPILSLFLQIGYDKEKGLRLSSVDLSSHFTKIFMSPEIFILLSSLTIFKAVDKLQINRYMCRALLKILQPYPYVILFAFMILNLILGCFFSTIATTTFLVSLALPILQSNDRRENLSKAFLLGISWSSHNASILSFNITDHLPYSRIETFIYTFPCIFILTIVECMYLLKVFELKKHKIFLTHHPVIKNECPLNMNKLNVRENLMIKKNSWNFDHYFMICIMFSYFFLISYCEDINEIGILSLIPIVFVYGKGILAPNEFNTLNWTVVAFAGGIIALTESIKLSGLFDLTVDFLFFNIPSRNNIISKVNIPPNGIEWIVSVVYLFIISFFSSFFWDKNYIIERISYLWNGSPFFLALCFLMIHVSQLLHISTFSNLLVSSILNDQTNEPILSGSMFFRHGIIAQLFALVIFETVGYYLINSLEG